MYKKLYFMMFNRMTDAVNAPKEGRNDDALRALQGAQEEAEQIVSAIATHRLAEVRDRKDLNGLLYRADKLSRPCYCCKQESACNWKGDKKNRQLIW